MKGRRGLTLMELLLVLASFAVLMTALLAVLQNGSDLYLASLESRRQAEALYRVPTRLLEQLRFSAKDSVSVGTDGFAFMTAYDEQGRFCYDSSGRPLWQGYEVVYLTGDELRQFRKPLAPTVEAGLLNWPPEVPKQSRLLLDRVHSVQLETDSEQRWTLRLRLDSGEGEEVVASVACLH